VTGRRLPEDPIVRKLVRAQSRPSRRTVLAAGAGATAMGWLLTACGTGGSPDGASRGPAEDLSETEKIVNWANWTLYLDVSDDGSTYPTLDAFEAETGITVNYAEDIDSNDAYFGKIQGQLANGQDIGQDILTFTDWMIARMIRLGYAQDLDKTRIPNAANILDSLSDVSFDPDRKNSLTWQSGFGGLAWNTTEIPGGLHTVDDLWDPSLAGRV
jgi:spermidine/putrescine transport system substrate-binding protein